MKNHIEKLVSETQNISVVYHAATTVDGRLDIGVRALNGQDVIIDGTPWLIAGDIYSKPTNMRISDVRALEWYRPNGLQVNLRAQAIIAGQIVQVHLGKRDVVCKTETSIASGQLDLVPVSYL